MPDSKPEMSREQHARIESLANEYGAAVTVHPISEAGIVKVQVLGRTLLLNEDGDETAAHIARLPVRLPTDLVRRMIGTDVVDDEISSATSMVGVAYPDYAAGRELEPHIEARIAELLATSEAVHRRVPAMARTNTVEDAAREARDAQDVGHRNVGSRQMDVDEAPGRDEL